MSQDKPSHINDKHTLAFTLPSRLFANPNILRLDCVDCHAGGEPARVVLQGFPPLPDGHTTAESKRLYIRQHYDVIRQVLLHEPRGYPCQNVNFVFQVQQEADQDTPTLQYVIAEQGKIYPLMSGHNTICVATALLECGVVTQDNFTLEAPAGPIRIAATRGSDGKVTSIALRNAPSFVEHLDITVNVPHLGPVVVDIAFGGMWYCVVCLDQFVHWQHATTTATTFDVTSLIQLDPTKGREICRIGEMIKVATREQYPVQHPTLDYPGVDILVFCQAPTRHETTVSAKNAVVMSNHDGFDWQQPSTWTGMMDRSPCGTGTCAVMAVLHARGLLQVGDKFVHSSIVGSTFTGRILETTVMNDERIAIVPEISGSAYITQYSQVVVDPEDPFPNGYRVGDIW